MLVHNSGLHWYINISHVLLKDSVFAWVDARMDYHTEIIVVGVSDIKIYTRI